MKKFSVLLLLAIMILAGLHTVQVSASGTTDKGKSKRSTVKKTKPTVAVIRADWCSACQKLEPTMMELMKEYGEKLNFVVFDVTNEETTAAAEAKAKTLGLSKFLEDNKKMTSTVAIFKDGKQTFKTMKNMDRNAYVTAFDEAAK